MSRYKMLVKYMQELRSLESILYTQDLLIDDLTRKANMLARGRAIQEKQEKAHSFLEYYPWIAPAVSCIALIVTAKSVYQPQWDALAEKYIAPSGGYYWGMNAHERTMEAFAFSVAIGLGVALAVLVAIKFAELIGKRNRQRQLNAEYSHRVAVASDKEKKRINHELEVKKNILGQIASIKAERNRTDNALTQLYNMNILADKYHGLVPVSMICEYLELGRCYELKGHEGAYNIYEYERRLNIIITQLEEIKTKLDEIKESQYALYQIMTQANNTLRRIEKSNDEMMYTLQAVKNNSELIEFNTRAAATAARVTGEFLVFKELIKG